MSAASGVDPAHRDDSSLPCPLARLGGILRIVHDPNGSLDELRECVERDRALAEEVTRLANSPLYGMAGKITRFDRVVLILGPQLLAAIASTAVAARVLRGVALGAAGDDGLLWHGLETGICAELIASCLDLNLGSDAYVAGVLHDLGAADLARRRGEEWIRLAQRARSQGARLDQIEQEAFGETHAECSAALAAACGFPEVLVDALAYHHEPLAASPSRRPLPALLHAAHLIVADPLGWSDATETAEGAGFLAELGLLSEDVRQIRTQLEERLKEVLAQLGPRRSGGRPAVE